VEDHDEWNHRVEHDSMSRTVYVDGAYVPEEAARVSVFDRGFLFADAVYEVVPVIDGKLLDLEGHLQRLQRSRHELEMPEPLPDDDLVAVLRKVASLNALAEGMIYLQITRGAGDREFLIRTMDPLLVVFSQQKSLRQTASAREGLAIITMPDLRWQRRDIKTTQLLYPSLAKSRAVKAGAQDAWLVEDGTVTEGTSNNAFIITKDGVIRTRRLSTDILHGITRAAILDCAAEQNLVFEERAFTIEEAQEASEAFVTAASLAVTPVVSIDGQPVGNGKPGPIAMRLREIYIAKSLAAASES